MDVLELLFWQAIEQNLRLRLKDVVIIFEDPYLFLYFLLKLVNGLTQGSHLWLKLGNLVDQQLHHLFNLFLHNSLAILQRFHCFVDLVHYFDFDC